MPLVQNPSLGGGQIAMLQSVVTLTQAQILAMSSVAPQLVAAPGAGQFLVPFGFAFAYDFGTRPYSLSVAAPAAMTPAYGQNGDNAAANVVGVITAVSDSVGYVGGNLTPFSGPLSEDVNQPLVLFGGNFNFGPIGIATLGAAGLGYVANDTGTITTFTGDATYKVLTVGAGGAVLTFQITAPGTIYGVGNGQATAVGGAQPGVGVGFTVNITAVQTGDGTLKVVTYYQIIPVP